MVSSQEKGFNDEYKDNVDTTKLSKLFWVKTDISIRCLNFCLSKISAKKNCEKKNLMYFTSMIKNLEMIDGKKNAKKRSRKPSREILYGPCWVL
jgi:hypothetical protein